MIVDLSVYLGRKRPFLFILRRLCKKPRWWGQFFLQLYYLFLLRVHLIDEASFQKLRWAFYEKMAPSKRELTALFKKHSLNRELVFPAETVIVDQVPDALLQALADGHATRGLTGGYAKLATRLPAGAVQVFAPFTVHFYLGKKSTGRIYFNRHFYQSWRAYVWGQLGLTVRDLALLLAVSGFFGLAADFIAGSQYNLQQLAGVFLNWRLVACNVWPVFITMLVLYAVLNSLTWASALGGTVWLVLGLVDHFMLAYRSYPFKYSDLKLASEAANMGHRYSYLPPQADLLIIVLGLLLAVCLHFICRPAKQSGLKTLAVLALAAGGVLASNHYYQQSYYQAHFPVLSGNKWNQANTYMMHGFVYSFVVSKGEDQLKMPAGYSEQKAQQILARYRQSQKIPKHKRINVLLLQLEAFQDFSKYKNLKIDPRVYAGLNQVRAEGMQGQLTTTVFGGGTVFTERQAITGYSAMQPVINSKTSSLVRYFDGQNYQTLKAHPGYGWFYNRQNISKYLGFQQFLCKENYYNQHVSQAPIVQDKLVLQDFNRQFDRRTKKSPLFTQLITYQNHGPYPTSYHGTKWLAWQKGYNQSDYAIINNYLNGVHQTSNQLLALTKMLQHKKQPIVLAFWGDHNPWGGNGNSTYKMLGVDLNQATQRGYFDYYDTPYVFWANEAAKKELAVPLKGQDPRLSPMYVVPTIMQHLGVPGSPYIQLLNQLKKELPVVGKGGRYLYHGRFLTRKQLPLHVQQELRDFRYVQYYRQTHALSN